MSKYCHDDSIRYCIMKCEECSAYYDDEEADNCSITEKDQEDFDEGKIRADERRKFAEEIKHELEYYYHGNVSKRRLRRILLDMLKKEQKK